MLTCPRCDGHDVELLTLTQVRSVDWWRCCACAHVWYLPKHEPAPYGLVDAAEHALLIRPISPSRRSAASR